MKKTVLTLAVLALLIGAMLVPPADATCNFTGKITYAYITPTYAYVYLVNSSAPYATTVYYYYTNSQVLITQLAAAQAANDTVYVIGSSTSCPTSGTYRYGGTINYAYRYKLY